jgi:hypothetical protein
MTDLFTPVDLSASYNTGSANTSSDERGLLWPAPEERPDDTQLKNMLLGEREFWGLPFKLGTEDAEKTFVQVAQKAKGVPESATIAIGATAQRLLFAHACAPIKGEFGTVEGTGEAIGIYKIIYADGSSIEQSLRRRFEVHDINVPWGHHPFLCRNCREFRSVELDDRSMSYGMAQVGVYTPDGHDLQGWWIYDWKNPEPDKTIKEIEVVAAGPTPLALAGITLCQEEGDPFVWASRKEIAVEIEGGAVPEVEMQRGVIARQDDLFVPGEDFLDSEEAGWGRGGQEVKKGGYVEVHGSEDGELTVRGDEGVEEKMRWGDVLERKQVEKGRVRIEVVSPEGKQWVHVRVEDEDTGEQIGTRVHFRTQSGAYIAPHGHQADVNIAWFEDMGGDCKVNGVPYAYIDGKCQIDLPVGAVYAELVRGFEYEPVRKLVEIKPGQRDLTLKMKRSFDMKKRGWYSGDTHVHFLSSQSAHLEAAAEDLNVTHLLASQWGRLFTSWEEFTGGLAPTSSEEHKIWVSQENRQHVLGHISLLGLKDMIAPICTGGPQEDWVGGEVEAIMADWAEACKKQGGLVIMPHMPLPDFENAANIVMGHADAGEMCWVWEGEKISSAERGYYRWLNVGQKLPIVGGTDKMSNGRILGGSRTYARLREGEEFTFDSWCQAVKRGSTFASTGAMIDLQVEGQPMGSEIQLKGNGGTVEVEVVAESVYPLTGVEIVVNGEQVAREESEHGSQRLVLKFKLKTELSCWVVARCWGPHHTDAGPVMAHSSPVYIDVGRRCAFVLTEGNYLMTHMEGGVAWAENIGVFRNEGVRQRLIGLFNEAKGELLRRVGS